MDDHGHGLSRDENLPEDYALSGKVMLSCVITFFLAVLFLLCLHLYSRRRTRRRLRHRLLFTTSLSLPSSSLDFATIAALPTFVFSADPSAKPPECAVCLSEFEDGELGRVLPKCGHRFHVKCIDTWLLSRSSCPVCRAPPEMVACVGLGPDSGSGSTETSVSSRNENPLPPPVECRRKSPDLEGIVVELAGGVGNRDQPEERVSGSNSRVDPDLSLKRFVST